MKVIGTEARISLTDFSGEFSDLEPWQRELVETFAAIPPDQRDKVVVVVGADGTASVASALGGTRGDRIIIDDPWAEGEPIDKGTARRMFERAGAMSGIDPVVIMSRLHDEPALKLAEAERFERLECRPLRAAELAQPVGPGNRAQRRADAARRRKGRR